MDGCWVTLASTKSADRRTFAAAQFNLSWFPREKINLDSLEMILHDLSMLPAKIKSVNMDNLFAALAAGSPTTFAGGMIRRSSFL